MRVASSVCATAVSYSTLAVDGLCGSASVGAGSGAVVVLFLVRLGGGELLVGLV